jgi:hypothetical protein
MNATAHPPPHLYGAPPPVANAQPPANNLPAPPVNTTQSSAVVDSNATVKAEDVGEMDFTLGVPIFPFKTKVDSFSSFKSVQAKFVQQQQEVSPNIIKESSLSLPKEVPLSLPVTKGFIDYLVEFFSSIGFTSLIDGILGLSGVFIYVLRAIIFLYNWFKNRKIIIL